MENEILIRMRQFAEKYGRELSVGDRVWRYYRLGQGPVIFWLTGGIRRAALGYAFMELLAQKYTVIAPDYPPVKTYAEFNTAFEGILQAERVERFHLGCQSYGGILAQPYLALHPQAVDRLVLSSTGPADYGRAWLPVEYIAIALVRILPEKKVKGMLAGGLGKFVSSTPQQTEQWQAVLGELLEKELTRADVISHFAVAADLIKRRIVRPGVFAAWEGRAVALSAKNDPTQSKADKARYEKLFGRPVEVISMGNAGHVAALQDPAGYVEFIEQALGDRKKTETTTDEHRFL
jgi:pimeloyl-ACP methyl ester carboxylesterase